MTIENLFSNGQKLEFFTNACYQSLNYYIETNLKVTEEKADSSGKIDILELDIYAKKFNGSFVDTTLIECKRGCSFNDLFMFSGISNVINANRNVMIAVSKNLEDIKNQATKLNIQILEPMELYSSIDESKEYLFPMHYSWNEMKSSILSKEYIISSNESNKRLSKVQKAAYSEVRSYLSLLNGRIWREPDLFQKANAISNLLNSHKDFVRKIARLQAISPKNKSSQYYIDSNQICQSAGVIVLEIKIAYIICAVECAISQIDIQNLEDEGFKNLVNILIANIELAQYIPIFLQYFFNVFGGIYLNESEDIANMSQVIGISTTQFDSIITFLKKLFYIPEINLLWGFEENLLTVCLKNTPNLYKAFGIINRNSLGFNTDMFVQKSEWLINYKIWRDNYEKN
ncbi:hypothetical protein [Marinilactibacillus psychrotolerans]|uniref:hypothetical protein n=1 Tax=Marinilactibacillus psychrotolerans TaxID=191770 RepID=UPI0038860A2A